MSALHDLKTQSLLEAILRELKEVNARLDSLDDMDGSGAKPTTYIPIGPSFSIPTYTPASLPPTLTTWAIGKETCAKCALDLSQTHSVICGHADCPCGLGPTTC